MTCSSDGSEGVAMGGRRELVHRVGAVQRCLREESAWSTATHCRQLSECLVPSVVPSTGGGVGDWLVLLLSLHQVSLTLTDDPPPTLMTPPPNLMTHPLP